MEDERTEADIANGRRLQKNALAELEAEMEANARPRVTEKAEANTAEKTSGNDVRTKPSADKEKGETKAQGQDDGYDYSTGISQ
jgi:hypothetical protein